MRLFLSILFYLLLTTSTAQLTIDHLYETTKTFNPWFGKDNGALTFSLELSHREAKDSTLNLVIAINENKMKLAGTTSTLAMSGSGRGILGALGVGMAQSNTYRLESTKGVAVFDAHGYDSLMNIIGKLKTLAGQGIAFDKTVMYKVNKIVLGLDIARDPQSRLVNKTYYFQIEDASFRLSEKEFADLCDDSLDPLRIYFSEFKNNRIIVIPAKK